MEKAYFTDEVIVDLADFYKVFADATRLKVLFYLDREGETCVGCIADALDMSQSAISQQLKVLRQNRLVKFRKSGKSVLYRVCDDHIHKILALGVEHYSELM